MGLGWCGRDRTVELSVRNERNKVLGSREPADALENESLPPEENKILHCRDRYYHIPYLSPSKPSNIVRNIVPDIIEMGGKS